jgi:hypothetical protein
MIRFVWCVLLTLATVLFLYKAEIDYRGHGYTASQRASLDEIVKNNTPLSVADIGFDAEQFMDDVHE